MVTDKSVSFAPPLLHQPRAFELCSSAHAQALWQKSSNLDLQLALPVTASAWEQLHDSRLAVSLAASIGEPWWLDLQRDEAKGTALFYVHPKLPCFAGHFPGQPLLPGVVQLEWAMGLAQRLWPDHCQAQNFAGLARLKFKAPVEPGAILAMQLSRASTRSAGPTETGVSLEIKTPTQTSTSARLLYRD